jgi:hypothetical protein
MEKNNKQKSLKKFIVKGGKRDLSFIGIVTGVDRKWLNISFPQKPKTTNSFIGLMFGAKRLTESFENSDYDLPIEHHFRDMDEVKVIIKTMDNREARHIVRSFGVSFPVIVTDIGSRWFSGIFPLIKESGNDDFGYDTPIDHPFRIGDELIVTIKRGKDV